MRFVSSTRSFLLLFEFEGRKVSATLLACRKERSNVESSECQQRRNKSKTTRTRGKGLGVNVSRSHKHKNVDGL
jgi:hypothetical protein